ncbi:MAG: hypothetical protein R3Y38_02420 [Rikenellaceae bacterium]
MKKILLSLVVLCASIMVSCGNAEVDKINELVAAATEQTAAATTVQEVIVIANNLQAQMEKIAAESGDKLSFGKNADAALAKYQEAATAKLAEFGLNLE